MPEKMRALFRGRMRNGMPAEWLGDVPGDVGDPANGVPPTPGLRALPARNLTEADWQAMPPAQRERVRTARNWQGEPLYDVRSDAEMAGAADTDDAPSAPPRARSGGAQADKGAEKGVGR